MARYVALLRGINVGGRNLIKMPDLKACFESDGFQGVATYIQSGNVLFDAGDGSVAALTERIEGMLTSTFDYRAVVIVRSARQLRAIVERAPAGFGTDPTLHRYDVVFLKAPLTASAVMKSIPTRGEVDRAEGGSGVIYFSRLISKAAQSRLSSIVSVPAYHDMSIRNWNTTTNLLRKLVERR